MKKNTRKHLASFTVALTGLILAAAPAQADVIANYTFNGGSALSTDSELNSDAGNFLIRPDNVGTDWGISTSSFTAFSRSTGTTNSEANADAADDYWSFTVTPKYSHLEMDLTSLDFNTQYNQTAGGASTTTTEMKFFLRSSVDGYVDNIGSTLTESWNGSTNRSVDLSASTFQDLQTATTFRIYIYDTGINSTAYGARLDNVVLNGTVIPEPSSSALLLGCFASLFLFRRRRG